MINDNLITYQNLLLDLLTGSTNSLSECEKIMYEQYNRNFNLELNIIDKNCIEFETTSTTTSTTTVCSTDSSPFINLFYPILNDLFTLEIELFREELSFYNSDGEIQNLFANNLIQPSCIEIFNQLISVDIIHNSFQECATHVQTLWRNGLDQLQQTILTVFNDCDIDVSLYYELFKNKL